MRLLSVNIGKIKPFDNDTGASAIDKRSQAVPVEIGILGLKGDQIADTKNHGGEDQAVYLFGQADYDWFAENEGITPHPGLFGENLTIEGLESQSINIGDRFEIGGVVLEATSPRIPCQTFAAHLNDRLWVKKFHKANRPGVYCRVLTEGVVTAGDEVRHIPFGGEPIPVTTLMTDYKNPAPERMRWLLKTPLHRDARRDYEKKLADA